MPPSNYANRETVTITFNRSPGPVIRAVLDKYGTGAIALFREKNVLGDTFSWIAPGPDGSRLVKVVVRYARPCIESHYRNTVTSLGDVWCVTEDSTRPQAKKYLQEMGCTESMPKIQTLKVNETIVDDEEDEDNTKATTARKTTRTQWAWSTGTVLGVSQTLTVKAAVQGVKLDLQIEFGEARRDLLALVEGWCSSQGVALVEGSIDRQ